MVLFVSTGVQLPVAVVCTPWDCFGFLSSFVLLVCVAKREEKYYSGSLDFSKSHLP